MAYVVIAQWTAKAGEEDAIADCLAEIAPHAQAEPGCLQYTVHRDPENPAVFVIYEQYADEAAFEAHRGYPHFHKAVEIAVPRLAERGRQVLETVD